MIVRHRLRAAALACAALALPFAATACHHDTPPPQNAAATAPANPTATGAMPVGSIKEERGDVRYVNPTLQPAARPDGGAR